MPLPRGRGARCEARCVRATGSCRLARDNRDNTGLPRLGLPLPGHRRRLEAPARTPRFECGKVPFCSRTPRCAQMRALTIKGTESHAPGHGGTASTTSTRRACKRVTSRGGLGRHDSYPQNPAAVEDLYSNLTHMSQVHWGHVGTRPDSVRVFTHRTTQSRWKTWPHNKRTHSSPASN